MRKALCLLSLGLAAGTLSAGTIQYQVTSLGVNNYRYTYFLSGFSLLANQEIDLRFDWTLYGTLSNPQAGSPFVASVAQPSNPPGTFGDFSLLTPVDSPSLAGPFSIDFIYLGAGMPGSQSYFVNQLGSNGGIQFTIEAGYTTPEPGTMVLCAAAGLFFCGRRVYRFAAARTNRR